MDKKNKPIPSPESLTQTTKKGVIELTEKELAQISGGRPSSVDGESADDKHKG